jgi:predicted HTH transcriptional regulator
LPEIDFLGALKSRWRPVILVGILVLAAGLLSALVLGRRYGRQLKSVPLLAGENADFERRILDLIGAGEGPMVEFKSTLRTNLRTGKPGKEIELAWIKGVVGFLNTDGGVLLIGVGDDGELLGMEADGFANEDKCLLHFKNLVHEHIGAQFSKYIHAEVRRVAGKQILAVTCARAAEPAFLIVGKNEEFHIRSGPSSMKLTPRQMLHYLNIA